MSNRNAIRNFYLKLIMYYCTIDWNLRKLLILQNEVLIFLNGIIAQSTTVVENYLYYYI